MHGFACVHLHVYLFERVCLCMTSHLYISALCACFCVCARRCLGVLFWEVRLSAFLAPFYNII